MPTARAFNRRAYQCSLYEAQDVLCEIDDVDLLRLEPGHGFRFRESWHRRLTYRDVSNTLVYLNPGLKPVRLTQDYDLFVAVCQNHWDLLYMNAVDGLEGPLQNERLLARRTVGSRLYLDLRALAPCTPAVRSRIRGPTAARRLPYQRPLDAPATGYRAPSTRFGSAHIRIHRPGRSTCTASDEDGKECIEALLRRAATQGHLLCL